MYDDAKHMEEFEKEAALREMHNNPKVRVLLYMWADFLAVVKVVNPRLYEGAFKRRPCKRKLRYIGYDNFEEPIKSEEPTEPYIYGEIYHSLSFNGATYEIKETGLTTGMVFFEVVD